MLPLLVILCIHKSKSSNTWWPGDKSAKIKWWADLHHRTTTVFLQNINITIWYYCHTVLLFKKKKKGATNGEKEGKCMHGTMQ